MALSNGIGDVSMLLFTKIMIKLTDAVHMTVDGLGLESFCHEIIDVARDRCVRHILRRYIQPEYEVSERIQIVLNGIGCTVSPL